MEKDLFLLEAVSVSDFAVLGSPWGLLAASALGGSTLSLPPWAVVLLAAAGILGFLVGMKYGDKWEEKLMERFRK